MPEFARQSIGPVKARRVLVMGFAHLTGPQHLLNFLPELQGHGSLRPILVVTQLDAARGPALSDMGSCFDPLRRQ